MRVRLLLLALVALSVLQIRTGAQGSQYDLPNDNTGCPANCRQIPWKAGTDLWNGGSIPAYPSVPCTGLVEGNGTTDNASKIQSCLNNAAVDTAVLIPPGIYYVNAALTIPSRKVLRGSGGGPGAQGSWLSSTYHGDTGGGARVTTLKFGPGGGVRGQSGGSLGTAYDLASGYTKGSTAVSLTTVPAGISANDYVIVSELQGDTSIPTSLTGDLGACTWCGESNASSRVMTQITTVTSVSGTTVNLSRPLYYTFKSGLAPRIREITMGASRFGIEDIKLWGSTTSRRDPHIDLTGSALCWVKGVETYDTPDVGKAYPVYMERSYGCEIRDSYFHFGRGNGGDRNYGIGMFGANSDHKVENNILRENRHSWSQEGGGSGNVFLYNYVDDNYTDDSSYLGSPRVNHGAHPYMSLFEGNIVSHFASDYYWGTSSHVVLFRNWLWGDASGNYSGFTSSNPNWGFVALELDRGQNFYSVVGNVLGVPGMHTNWASATLMNSSCGFDPNRGSPFVYGLGCVGTGGSYSSTTRSTMIIHGNYDYKTQGVAHWDGGSTRTALRSSMYYTSKPSFFGSCAWPAFGPDLSPITRALPAKERFELRDTCGSTGQISGPQAPSNLRIISSGL